MSDPATARESRGDGARSRRGAAVAALALVAALGALAVRLETRSRRSPSGSDRTGAIDVTSALAGAADPRFRRATEPRTFEFPGDHGPHDGFRTEWWYVTANLFEEADRARAHGLQLTFFRQALAPPDALPASRSAFRSPWVWMAHFALSDAATATFAAHERFAREALDVAGASAAPFAVHLGDWSLASVGEAFAPLRLRARDGDDEIELELEPSKPTVLQGDSGLSRKGDEPGNASYYYSIPRLAARGTLARGGRRVAVAGEAWLDREWSTSALGPGVVGWDWFALQLDDGRELMLYRLRHRDDTTDRWSAGSLVGRDGTVTALAADDFELEPLDRWTSPEGTEYPVRWRIRIPASALELDVRSRLEAQELAVSVRYWEGAVTVAGTAAGRPVAGNGFLELTGYTAAAPSED